MQACHPRPPPRPPVCCGHRVPGWHGATPLWGGGGRLGGAADIPCFTEDLARCGQGHHMRL
eukprot:4229791-Alexandrium_andersonii.AAC.1